MGCVLWYFIATHEKLECVYPNYKVSPITIIKHHSILNID